MAMIGKLEQLVPVEQMGELEPPVVLVFWQ